MERIREMLAAPPPAAQEPQPPQQAQRFFAGGGGGVGDEGTRAGVALQAYCEEYKGVPDGASFASLSVSVSCQRRLRLFFSFLSNPHRTYNAGLRGPVWCRILPSHEPLAQAFTEWLAGEAKDGQVEDGWRLGTVHRRHGVPNQVRLLRSLASWALDLT